MYRKLFLCLLIATTTMLFSLDYTVAFGGGTDGVSVIDSNPNSLVLDYHINELQISEVKGFTTLDINGFVGNNDVGRPELPFLGNLITVPINATVKVSYLASKITEISLKELGFTNPIYPAQPSYSKSQDLSLVSFVHDTAAYTKPDYQQSYTPFATSEVGFARGYRVFDVGFSPVQYNPVENTLKIYSQLTVELLFDNADFYQTEYERERTYSPDFEAVFEGMLLNYDPPPTRDTLQRNPTKYIIICYPSFATTMQPFVEWKTKQGFAVTMVTTATTGTTTTAIKTYMQNLWDTSDPKPTYLLIVGDTGQIPAFTGSTDSSHITDLNYVRLQGSDYLPEMYFGRFSATTTDQVQVYIDKTLMYEKYTMPDPSYLKNSLLIAGVDGSYATRYCNSLVDYVANQYIKSSSTYHTYNAPYTYTHPTSGNYASNIRSQFSSGVGWANYTAHGDTDRWYDPSFTNTHVNSLTNSGKYPIAIGNACLTSAFDTGTCFAEAMVRTANKGAVLYIGGTNSTYWNEDWVWAAGNKSAPSGGTGASYSASNLGMYDRLFHTHNESISNWDISAGAMVYIGNSVVQSITSNWKSYYWEIYSIMGDPSLVPYLGLPSANNAQYPTQIITGQSSISITGAGALARIAISRGGVLAGAAIADASGNATLTFTPFTTSGAADLVITSQNKIPKITTINVANSTLPGFAISSTNLIFDEISINQTSPTQTVTLSNAINGPITISSITKSGANASDFNLTVTGLPWVMSSADTRSFTVSFTPSSPGAKMASISIVSNATGSPHIVNLTGTGANPGFTISSTNLSFNEVTINQTSPTQTVTISNIVSGPITISNITKSGVNATDFNLTVSGLPWTMNSADTRTFTVSFTPTTTGAKTASISIASNATGSPHTISLSGTGASPGLTLPYTQNFNSGTNLATISWEGLVTPNSYSGIKQGSGVGGTNGLVLNVWGSETTLQVYTPRIAAITSTTTLSFAYRIVAYTSNWGGTVNGYSLSSGDKVYIEVSSTGGTGSYTTLREINSTNHTTASNQFTTLELPLSAYNAQNVNIRFRAVRTAGDWCFVLDNVDIHSTTTSTPPPSSLTAQVNAQNVTLTWTAPQNPQNQTGYTLHRGTTLLTTTPTTTLTYTDQNVTPGTHTYSIRAVYAAGTSEPATAQAVVQQPPGSILYTQNFNSGTNMASINWGGTLSSYSGIKANSGVNNTNGLSLNVYSGTTNQNAYTPTITGITSGVTLSFAYRIVSYPSANDWSGTVNGYALATGDKVFIEVSTTGGTGNYIVLQEINNTNHTTASNEFSTLTLPLTAYNAQNINIRFRAVWAASDWCFVLDDVVVQAPIAQQEPPQNLSAIAGNNSVSLSWQAPSSGTPQGYKVYRNATAISGVITATTYIDNTAQNGNQYAYYVSAMYAGGTEVGCSPINVGLDNILPPVNLTANVEQYDVTLSWSASRGGHDRLFQAAPNPLSLEGKGALPEYSHRGGMGDFVEFNTTLDNAPTRSLQGYKVYRGADLLTSNPITSLTYTDDGVAVGSYTYKVSAVFSNGESSLTEITDVTVYNIQPPQNLVVTTPGVLTAHLTWEAPTTTSGLLYYNIYRCIETCSLEIYQENIVETTYTDSGLDDQTTYYYRVTAVFITGESNPTATEVATPTAVFNPVNNLNAVIGFNSVALSWTAPEVEANSATLLGYRVMRNATVLADSQEPEILEYTDATAQNGEAYSYYVAALYSQPEGESVAIEFAVQMKVFNPPSGLVYFFGDHLVVLNWQAPAQDNHSATLTGYKIYRDDALLPSGVITNTQTFIDDGVQNGISYDYYIIATYTNPVGESIPSETLTADPPLSDSDEPILPMVTKLAGNYPNPFNPSTTINFSLAREDRVRIDIYSVNGQLVRSLVNGTFGVGMHQIVWNGRDELGRSVSSGVYFYRMSAGEYTAVKKMLLVK